MFSPSGATAPSANASCKARMSLCTLPDWLHVYREVTDDPRYTNRALARSVPDEIL